MTAVCTDVAGLSLHTPFVQHTQTLLLHSHNLATDIHHTVKHTLTPDTQTSVPADEGESEDRFNERVIESLQNAAIDSKFSQFLKKIDPRLAFLVDRLSVRVEVEFFIYDSSKVFVFSDTLNLHALNEQIWNGGGSFPKINYHLFCFLNV
jgi:hypothetical protein